MVIQDVVVCVAYSYIPYRLVFNLDRVLSFKRKPGIKNIFLIWDIIKKKKLRKLLGHSNKIGSLSWNNFILSSGSNDTNIINHDIRIKKNIISYFKYHEQQICNLKVVTTPSAKVLKNPLKIFLNLLV